jgi:hypothetical protein
MAPQCTDSHRSCDRSRDLTRHVDLGKTVGEVQVVFARFVYHTDEASALALDQSCYSPLLLHLTHVPERAF